MLEKSLRMLHPFMPFLTEEVWQGIPHEGDSIMVQKWPHVQKQMISKEAEREMSGIIEVVTAIRNMRADWNIEPRQQVKVLINTSNPEARELLERNSTHIKNLSRCDIAAI